MTNELSFKCFYAAKELIEEKKVLAIVGMHTWLQTALVAEVGTRAQVPILALAPAAMTPPSASTRWPFLIQMANDDSQQVQCISSLVHSYNWRRVIVIYEDDAYGSDSGMLTLLSEALQSVGSEIEYRLALPPYSSLGDPRGTVDEELEKVLGKQSRVFIVLQSSFPLATYLFREAKKKGLVERDSVWIITDKVANFLDSFNSSVITSVEGALGIKTYYKENTRSYVEFYDTFRRNFRTRFPEEDNNEPGIYALRAYDSIIALEQALEKTNKSRETSTAKALLNNILSSNFTGLSGEISFQAGQLSEPPVFRIVNLVGKRYKELDYWIPGTGFSKDPLIGQAREQENFKNGLVGSVYWPGDPGRVPKGWAMPTKAKPLVIGVPARTQFEKFVKVGSNEEKNVSGFCIEIFEKILDRLGYALEYEIRPLTGPYSDLVQSVNNKVIALTHCLQQDHVSYSCHFIFIIELIISTDLFMLSMLIGLICRLLMLLLGILPFLRID